MGCRVSGAERAALKKEHIEIFEKMCAREKVPFAVIGTITGDGFAVLYDESDGSTPVNLALGKILGDMPRRPSTLTVSGLKAVH